MVAIIQQNPLLKKIFDKIYEQSGRILLVGGVVRDCLLQKQNADLDFEVYHLNFDQLQKILSQFGPVSFVGKSFGVLRLHSIDADWSIPRKDSSGRKPQVDLDPNMSFEEAFKRRDLTINAMGIDVKTFELIDPFDGLKDLQNNILRSPDYDFFVQDPLRLFRVMQFMARFDMNPDDRLNQVCQIMDISGVSGERIDQEFKKLFLKSEKPSIGLRWLYNIGRFQELFPELTFQEKIMQAIDCLAHQDLSNNQKLAGMWALLSTSLCTTINVHHPATKKDLAPCKSLVQKYAHSLDIVDTAAALAWYVHYIPQLAELKDYKWLAHWMNKYGNLELLAIVGSCLFEQSMIDTFVQQAQQAGVLQKEEAPLLQGADLLDHAQGKELGDLVKKAYAMQLDQNMKDKNTLLKLVVRK